MAEIRSLVEVGSLSHYLQGFSYIPAGFKGSSKLVVVVVVVKSNPISVP